MLPSSTVLSAMQTQTSLAAVQPTFCFICREDSAGDKRCCMMRGSYFYCCITCSQMTSMCPHCHDPACKLPRVGQLSRDDLMQRFPDARNSLREMNPTMFVKFTAKSVEFGVTKKGEPAPTRGSGGANFKAFVNKDNNGVVKLDRDDEFEYWAVGMYSAQTLAAGVDMVRTVLDKNGAEITQNLGPAEKWTRALRYGTNALYPTFVGFTKSGRHVRIGLACNPDLPGFIVWGGEEEVLSAVDIPSPVWKTTPTLNDSRVFALAAGGSSTQVLQLRVSPDADRGKTIFPSATYHDSTGCLVEEYHGIPRDTNVVMHARSLGGETLYPVICPVDENGLWDLSGPAADPESPFKMTRFWGKDDEIYRVGFQCEEGEHGDVWGLQAPGMPGVFLYKCVLLPPPPPELFALRHARWPGKMALGLRAAYQETATWTLDPAESYVEDTGCLVHKYKGIVQDATVMLHVSSPSPVNVDRIYFPVKADGGLDGTASKQWGHDFVPGNWQELGLPCTRRRGEHGDAWVLQAPECPGIFLFKCFFLP